jgi:hypothetical protein
MDAIPARNVKRTAQRIIADEPLSKKYKPITSSDTGYSAIRAIIISFEDHDFNKTAFDQEINSVVDLFENELGAEKCLQVKIPAHYGALVSFYVRKKVEEFKAESAKRSGKILELVYFTGHGYQDDSGALRVDSKAKEGQSFDWSYLQRHYIFGIGDNDVLVLLDCCSAAQEPKPSLSGCKDVFAACSAGEITAEPGPWSFTSFLVKMGKSFDEPFTISQWMERTSVMAISKRRPVPRHQQFGHYQSQIILTPQGCVASEQGMQAAKRVIRRQVRERLGERIFQINATLDMIWELRGLDEDNFPGSDEVTQMEADTELTEPFTQVGVYRALRRLKDCEFESGLGDAMP